MTSFVGDMAKEIIFQILQEGFEIWRSYITFWIF